VRTLDNNNNNRKGKNKMNTQAKKIRNEARLVVAFISVGIVCLLWAIHANAVIGDAYAAFVLALTVCALGALGSFIVTTELRDNLSRNSRAIILALHAQQMNELRAELDAVHCMRDEYAETLSSVIGERDGLRVVVSQKENALANTRAMRDKNATLANELRAEITRLKNSVMDIRETLDYTLVNDEYTHSASTAFALGTLDLAYIVDNETRYPLRNK
jgi:hypothetical protein